MKILHMEGTTASTARTQTKEDVEHGKKGKETPPYNKKREDKKR